MVTRPLPSVSVWREVGGGMWGCCLLWLLLLLLLLILFWQLAKWAYAAFGAVSIF